MTAECASYLRGARALLNLKIKSVARALRFSDKTLTQLERDADEREPKARDLIQFYEDLGLHFTREGPRITSVVLTDYVNLLVLSLRKHGTPDQAVDRLCNEMRYIGGLVYNLKQVDKTKASKYDTIEVHFPVPTRGMAREILCRWFEEEGGIEVMDNDGNAVSMTRENVARFL